MTFEVLMGILLFLVALISLANLPLGLSVLLVTRSSLELKYNLEGFQSGELRVTIIFAFVIILLGLLVFGLKRRKDPLHLYPWSLLLGAFFLLPFLRGVSSNVLDIVEPVIRLFFFISAYYISFSAVNLKNQKALYWLLNAIILSTIIPIAVANYSIMTGYRLKVSTFDQGLWFLTTTSSRNAYVVYLCLVFPILLGLSYSAERKLRMFYTLWSLVMLVSIIISSSRIGVILVTLSLVLFILTAVERLTSKLVYSLTATLLGAIISLKAGYIIHRFSLAFSPESSTLYERFRIWGYVLRFLSLESWSYWITGRGSIMELPVIPHNSYVQALYEFGVLGLGIYIMLYLKVLRASLKVIRQPNFHFSRVILKCILISQGMFLVASITENLFLSGVSTWLFWVLSGITAAVYGQTNRKGYGFLKEI